MEETPIKILLTIRRGLPAPAAPPAPRSPFQQTWRQRLLDAFSQ